MIKTKHDLHSYLAEDAKLYPKLSGGRLRRWKNILVTNPSNSQHLIYNYLRNLRYSEFHLNNSYITGNKGLKALIHTVCCIYRYWRLRALSYKTGIQIPPNTFGKGLQIWHYGPIVINPAAKVGDYATIYPGVVIGAKENGMPVIGDHCFIGAGCKVLGGVSVGNNVTIAPNAVVVKDVPDNCVVAGVPAKIIKYN